MALPEAVISYLNENAEREGVATPQAGDDLFKLGVLDSFTLVDFVSILGATCSSMSQLWNADVRRSNGEMSQSS